MGFDKTEYLENEQIRMVPGFEGLYSITNYGKVQRLVAGHNTYVGKVLKPLINKRTGYPYVKLTKNGKVFKKQLHILVAQLFLSTPEKEEFIVNHIDGNKLNPKWINLEWISRSDNTKHAIRTGLQKLCYGENNGASKLKAVEVKQLREDYTSGNYNQKQLAEKYNISVVYVSNLINNKFRTEG
jgi:hypothetical protein